MKDAGGDSIEKLFKKGASGRKATAERFMVIEAGQLKYAKKENDLKNSKGVKIIDLKGAAITSEKDSTGRFWIRIKGGKENREIATSSKDSRDKWINALTAASGGPAPSPDNKKKKDEPKKEDPKKKDEPKKE